MRCLWDSDVMSEFLKGRDPVVVQKAAAYLQHYNQATLSEITRYEILRGLKAKNATAQVTAFDSWCQQFQVLPLTDDIIILAADLWAGLKQTGQPIGDNDPLIAATAIHHGLPLATKNVAHFSRIPGLAIEDWTQP
jgi:tRNA(fMet)-specific endonuclease VapC